MSEREKALSILKKLNDNGHQAFIVGGAVRDSLLGKNPKDYDISTSALPNQIADLFSDCGVAYIEAAQAYPVMTVSGIEVASFRKDMPGAKRENLSSMQIGATLEDDSLRRDLTFNSLYQGASGAVLDPCGQGLSDLQAKLVRFVGEAQERLDEDACRGLRAIVFAAKLDFSLEEKTKKALQGITLKFKEKK